MSNTLTSRVTFKAACHRSDCGWFVSGTNHFKVIGDFLQHLEEAHGGEYSVIAIGILELGCETDGFFWGELEEGLGRLFEE
jgi:predicted small metal-binding protein